MSNELRVFPPATRRPLVPNEVLGTAIFILTEIMMFAGFISAFTVAKANMTVWPPPNQPRLPIEATAFNTAVLLASGVLVYLAGRRYSSEGEGTRAERARNPLMVGMVLGMGFVALQGFEWTQLLAQGLTLTSTSHGSFFYLIVGAHGLHVCVGLTALIYLFAKRRTVSGDLFQAGRLYWYFVVGLWPVLYYTVYL